MSIEHMPFEETVPDENALMIDVMTQARDHGQLVISDGKRIVIANRVREGYHRIGGVIRQSLGRPS